MLFRSEGGVCCCGNQTIAKTMINECQRLVAREVKGQRSVTRVVSYNDTAMMERVWLGQKETEVGCPGNGIVFTQRPVTTSHSFTEQSALTEREGGRKREDYDK